MCCTKTGWRQSAKRHRRPIAGRVTETLESRLRRQVKSMPPGMKLGALAILGCLSWLAFILTLLTVATTANYLFGPAPVWGAG